MEHKWGARKGIKIAKIVLFFLYVTICLPSHVSAAEISGVTFKENFQDQGINMRLQGTGLKTVFFFKAFVAGFYADRMKEADTLGEFSKRIEVEYFINIPANKLNHFTIEQMKLNLSPVEMGRIQHEVKLMGKYFVDLKPGDRFSLTYIPGTGTKFVYNGQLVGTIQGSAFARALFAVWIGKKPFDEQLKEQIYGLAKTEQGQRKVNS